MSSIDTTYGEPAPVETTGRDLARALLGPVMGFVAVTVGCTALGAYLGRDLSGLSGLLLFIPAIGCIIGLNVAASRGREQLAIGLLFAMGLLLGLAVAPVLADYATPTRRSSGRQRERPLRSSPRSVLWLRPRRDLSSWGRTLFWALLALIVFGIVAIFVSIPNENIIWSVAGLGIFGAYTIYDFNRLRRTSDQDAPLIAASIFLDIFNVFLFFLNLFGGE